VPCLPPRYVAVATAERSGHGVVRAATRNLYVKAKDFRTARPIEESLAPSTFPDVQVVTGQAISDGRAR